MPRDESGHLFPVPTAAAMGGKARAAKLTKTQRSESARVAAESRWRAAGKLLPRATHAGVLPIGNTEIQCFVLEDGTRILHTRGVMKSLGRRWRGRKYRGTELPVFLEANNLKPFIDSNLREVSNPLLFRTVKGAVADGFKADILPAVCEVYLEARRAKALTKTQLVVAAQCEILVRALSRIGITALIDEATGYEEVRDRQALQKLLDLYLRQEFAAWAKRFPDEFYQQIFRLCGWQWRGMKVNRPVLVGKFTRNVVYARLLPGIVKELEERNPADDQGHRRVRHHQFLTEEIGHPALTQHLTAVMALMRASDTWGSFKKLLDKALPVKTRIDDLPLFRQSGNAIGPERPA